MNVLDFLIDIGKHFSVSSMINRHTVAKRLESGEGISYTEFSYQVFQAIDYLQLCRTRKCILQVGGSDQYGNIASGIDLIRRVNRQQVFGLTTPLMLTKNGEKFGKTEGNAVWASNSKESLFACHQYLMSVPDRDVIKLLKSLTFMSLEEIEDIAQKIESEEIRGQEVLSKEVLSMISGSEERAASVLRYTEYFRIDFQELAQVSDPGELVRRFEGILGCVKVSKSILAERSDEKVEVLLREVGIRDSFKKIRRLVKSKGLTINNVKVNTWSQSKISDFEPFGGVLWVVRIGKKEFGTILFTEEP